MHEKEENMETARQIEGQISIFEILGVNNETETTPATESVKTEAETPTQPVKKATNEFGEHIGGARKELWAARGLMADDLLVMNAAERAKFVKKDNVWKKPDYIALVEAGTPIVVAYAIKKIRDALPTTPRFVYKDKTDEQKQVKQEQYISVVSEIRDKVMSLKTEEDLLALPAYLENAGFITWSAGIRRYAHPTEKIGNLLSDKLFQAFNLTRIKLSSYECDLKKEQFCVEAGKKVPAGYQIRFYDGEGISRGKDWLPNTYFVAKGCRIMETNFKTYDEALEYLKKNVVKKGKKRLIPPQLENLRRNGLEDYRGDRDITGQDYIDTFRIRGGEFGEWMSEKDAQASLNMAYEAFYDLAKVLKLSPGQISIQGKLAIAFGARGRGNAVAHYEPMREVINLTKMRGAGSLAHEYFHALDDICGKALGLNGMMTEAKPREMPEAMKAVIEAMQYRPATKAEEEAAKARRIMRTAENIRGTVKYMVCFKLTPEQIETRDAIVEDAIANVKGHEKTINFMNHTYAWIEKLSALNKAATGHVLNKDSRERLYYAYYAHVSAMTEKSTLRIETEFYKNSKEMDKHASKEDKGYWSSECEMFARAGACYVTDKLKALGGVDDYLSGHSESAVTLVEGKDGKLDVLKAMPLGEERERINAAIDKLLEWLRSEVL